ncbi:hypothetical protein V8F33_003780 [Rhypophila sp. PSN 637]
MPWPLSPFTLLDSLKVESLVFTKCTSYRHQRLKEKEKKRVAKESKEREEKRPRREQRAKADPQPQPEPVPMPAALAAQAAEGGQRKAYPKLSPIKLFHHRFPSSLPPRMLGLGLDDEMEEEESALENYEDYYDSGATSWLPVTLPPLQATGVSNLPSGPESHMGDQPLLTLEEPLCRRQPFDAGMTAQPALSKEQQEQVVIFMQSRGHQNYIDFYDYTSCSE